MAFPGEEDYQTLIEPLPKKGNFRLYRGFWFRESFLPWIIHFPKIFKSRPSDIYLMTYPKCGTTWIKALSFSVLNRESYSSKNHPLLTTHPQRLFPSLHYPSPSSGHEWDLLPSPRLFGSHFPYSFLPDSIKSDDSCKMIYVTRDPKDAFISRYFFLKETKKGQDIHLRESFDDFCEGYGYFGSYWDHRMEYERESLKRPEKVLFLRYEEMKESTRECVRRIAEFLGKPFSEEEERGGVVEEIVKLCSIDFLKELEVNKHGVNFQISDLVLKNSAYFRKGKVGDWKEHLTAEMAERMDKITQQKQLEYGLIN